MPTTRGLTILSSPFGERFQIVGSSAADMAEVYSHLPWINSLFESKVCPC
jgi:hypothetical protein